MKINVPSVYLFFRSTDDQEALFDQILMGQLDFPLPYWDNVSDSAKVSMPKRLGKFWKERKQQKNKNKQTKNKSYSLSVLHSLSTDSYYRHAAGRGGAEIHSSTGAGPCLGQCKTSSVYILFLASLVSLRTSNIHRNVTFHIVYKQLVNVL